MVESDEEQLEVIKNWWNENGTSIVVTLVLVLGGSFGYRAWENSVVETGEAASAAYEDLVAAVSAIDLSSDDEAMRQTAQSLTQSIKSDHADSAYAVFAAMQMAKVAVDTGDLDNAQAELEWALGKVDEPHLESIIRTRLARVLLAKEDATAAMSRLINYEPEPAQMATYEEVKGDAYVQLGDMQSARESYQKAIGHLGSVRKPVLELKLADIPLPSGGVAVQIEDTESGSEDETEASGDEDV